METQIAVKKLEKEFNENINSHIFLVETNDLEQSLKDIKSIIKNKIKANEQTQNQIDNESYIEQIIIRPDGNEIKKDQIMILQDRLKTKPILSDYIFYIITPAETLSEISSNKLLKTIEEPNDNVIGFMLTTNPDHILSTIKSRCERVTLIYDKEITEELEETLVKLAGELTLAIEKQDHILFTQIKSQSSLIKENHKIIENLIKDYYNMACNLNTYNYLEPKISEFIKANNTYHQIILKAKHLNKRLNKLNENMNSDLVLENMYLELKGVK